MKETTRRRLAAMVCALAVALAPLPSAADEDRGMASEAGIGVLAALGTLVYGPVKIVYAALGVVFGGASWGLSAGDNEVFEAVITPSVRGDYVLTPKHLRGERTLEFVGRRPEYRYDQTAMLEETSDDSLY